MSPVSKGRKRKPAKVGRKGRARGTVAPPGVDSADVSPEGDVESVVERRRFVMPFRRAVIGGEALDGLDPADPEERALLLQGEHPDLPDGDFETDAEGFSPRFHLTMHEVIANQLWDDEPPEVWRAAVRLRGQGLGRHEILHALMNVMVTHMRPTLAGATPFDTDAYRRELDGLGGGVT